MKRTLNFPIIPPKESVLSLIHQTDNLKHKTILMLIYGSGLRVSEVAKLKISDICSKTMRVRVHHAKHNTNRYTILPQEALVIMRQYFKKEFALTGYQLSDWLFPGNDFIRSCICSGCKAVFKRAFFTYDTPSKAYILCVHKKSDYAKNV
ncbi:tyrosine-type recombinase/integrase [Bacillus benzoevorans]|uniref:Site-specific recombinase XerD n=1 Tax=Bacillus benzoevorans TaxID=1456 RepID=A0A7X0HWC1_9BACI|nr:tyrosine-type recombinase/integrase [Bacillus benzoevorans]MBB6446825.1 site-specific recombinase XerD [Bacillus benzoevorans]